jgi:hypothetical protein
MMKKIDTLMIYHLFDINGTLFLMDVTMLVKNYEFIQWSTSIFS